MRTIKFRGKDSNGNWRYGSLIQYKSGETAIAKFSRYGYECSDMNRIFVDPATVGQFTGLCDKNGKEIYEGDIIAARGMTEKLEVRFVRGVFAFLWNGNLDNEFPTGSPTHEWAEVVGNIHDNFDLLKKGNRND